VGAGALIEMLRRVGWTFLAVCVVYAAHVAVRATALWRAMIGDRATYGGVLRTLWSGEAVEMLTLAGPALGEPAKAWLLQQQGIDTTNAFGAVAIEYLLYNVVAFGLVALTAAELLARGVLSAPLRGAALALLVAAAAFMTAFGYAALTRTGLVAPAAAALLRALGLGRRAAGLRARVEPIEEVLVSFIHDQPRRLAEVLAIEIVGHALLAFEIWVVLGAIDIHAAPIAPILMEGGIKIIGVAFFFIPGQLGASEGVYVAMATALGFGPTAGLTIALVRRARALLVAATGLPFVAGRV
jgi:hypothetical protein